MDITDIEVDLNIGVTEELLVEAVREAYPSADMRRGTAIRDLLIRPMTRIYTFIKDKIDKTRKMFNLSGIADSGIGFTPADINRILANFNTSYIEGTPATGYIRFVFTSPATRVIPEGYRLVSESGDVELTTTTSIAVGAAGSLEYETVYEGTSEPMYAVNAAAVTTTVGHIANLTSGVSLTPVVNISKLDRVFTVTSFSGGTDAETIPEVIARLPRTVASRSLTNKTSMMAMLTDHFGEVIEDISLQGVGSVVQNRDRVFGVSAGGCVDAYIRTFREPSIKIIKVTGIAGDGYYTLSLPEGDAAGAYAVRAVTDWDESYTATDLTQGYTIAASWGLVNEVDRDGHRIPNEVDGALSAYQTAGISVYKGDAVVGDAGKDFKVELYVAPLITEIQEFCDAPIRKNMSVDLLVKAPVVASVTLNCTVALDDKSNDTEDVLRSRAVDYINSVNFTGILRLSDILRSIGHTVDMPPGKPVLQVIVYGADGEVIKWAGNHDMKVSDVSDTSAYIDPSTVVFMADPTNINIKISGASHTEES